MTPDVVVDVGNTRIKWGLVEVGSVRLLASLPHSNPGAWAEQLAAWHLDRTVRWAAAGVQPGELATFERWAESRGDEVRVISSYKHLPIALDVDEPAKVGIDRLLNAVAAKFHTGPGISAVVIDVGTAVTVDLLDEGVFAGGAIFPGPRLMAKSLNDHTAKLPLVEPAPVPPGRAWGANTREAIEVGLAAAVIGAADHLVREMAERVKPLRWVFVTGGAHGYFGEFKFASVGAKVVTTYKLTLEGIRVTAEALP
ncbi:MAG TPA: type III pantothenate kinase [Fimbriiglobus sp.]|nr:type III pantothenate kinase [Fimbriiglobus sp.]